MPSLLVGMFRALLTTAACISAVSGDIISDWNAAAQKALVDSGAQIANNGTRVFAALHVAQWRAVNEVLKSHGLTAQSACADPQAHTSLKPLLEAAVGSAGKEVLMGLLPNASAAVGTVFNDTLQPDAPREAVLAGTGKGQEMVKRRTNDGSAPRTGSFLGSNDTGRWRPTPPKFAAYESPFWGKQRTWVMEKGSTFRIPPPPTFRGEAYKKDYLEIMELGNVTSAKRTADQSDMALFWTTTPEFTWFAITQQVANQTSRCDIIDNAQLYAFVSVVLADGWIAAADNKLFYSTWRPVSAITEGNGGDLAADPFWSSFTETPATPEYPSGHCSAGAHVAEALRVFTGTDTYTFTVTSASLPDKPRSYKSLSEAAKEICDSRVYGGEHFRYSTGQVVFDLAANVTATAKQGFDSKITGGGKRRQLRAH